MSEFKQLSEEEIQALTPEQLEEYNTNLATWEKEQEANAKDQTQEEDLESIELPALKELAKERGYTFPQNMGKDKLIGLMKNPPVEKAGTESKEKAEPKAKAEEAETITGYETTDGYQFPIKNDANNHAHSLPEGEREVKEVTIKKQ